jgi:DNA-binding transcriptional ArsR family regulator
MAYALSLQALADPTRRSIFERLRRGPRAVGELALGLPVSRPAVSQHLRVLKGALLVREERQGTRNVYSIDPRGLAELREYVEGFWDDALSAFKEAAEREAKGGRHARPNQARRPKRDHR